MPRPKPTALRAGLAVSILMAGAAFAAQPKYGTWGVDYASMDPSVRPGDDFFAYAEGTWLRAAPIAPDKAAAGYNYDLPDQTELDLKAMAEDAERRRDTPEARQIADLYGAWMDESGVEARGLQPLQPYLARISGAASREALVQLMVEPGFAGPVRIGLGPDVKDPTRYVVEVRQARLGLPTRDYYLLHGAKYEAIRTAYRAYIARIFTLAGLPEGGERADRILALETRISQDQWTPERRRDPVATYNPMDRTQLAALAPQFDWTPSLAHIGLASKTQVIVGEPSAVAAAGRQLDEVPLSTWKDYVAFRFISDHADFLPAALDEAHFDFYGRTLRDLQKQSVRWKRGVRLLDAELGEAVGKIYVQTHWSGELDRQAAELIADLRDAYSEKIRHAGWMDGETRGGALKKLASFEPRIGHPQKYIDYSELHVSPTDPLGNALASSRFEWRLRLSRMDKPVDRTLWEMTPQTVNAYYDPRMNQVTFPAAQLQPPFFDAAADPAVNYGETGATIGHEMGHGFDDEGRQFDDRGRLRDWWTKTSAERYTAHAQELVKQFNAYEPLPGVHINGALTLGENLGDLGGLEAAYAAYRLYIARHGEPPVIDGYTGDQRFFIAYAQSWQGKQRDGSLREQLLSDPHSPDAYRVNGIVRNFDPWYAAFHVIPGQSLYLQPDQRVHVW